MNILDPVPTLKCPECQCEMSYIVQDHDMHSAGNQVFITECKGCYFTVSTSNLQVIIDLFAIETKPPQPLEKIMYLYKWVNEKEIPYGVVIITGPQSMGWSICSDIEQFSRKRGRNIARGRINDDNHLLPRPYDSRTKVPSANARMGRTAISMARDNLLNTWLDYINSRNHSTV